MRWFVLSIIGLSLLGWGLAAATDDPHGATDSIYCGQCHVPHATLGEILVNSADSLLSTLCLSCHTPGGWVGMTKEFSSAEKAIPGQTGTSHAWDAPAINPERGADLPQTALIFDHLAADSSITCATCHDPHSNADSPFLRLDNSADALCLDCHADRNMASVRTYTGNELSHPVGITLPETGYHSPPLDTDGNPQPSDGNTTNDYKLGAGGEVLCTSCHGVHYTDSNSGTVDGP